MNGRRAIVGLCMLCALFISAFAAQSAPAITGTTSFTCVKDAPPKNLRGEHCLTTGTAPQEYGHVAIAQDTTTEVTTTNSETANNTTEATTARLKVTIAGVPLELGATAASGSGWMTNALNGSEHYLHGEGTTTFTGVQVTKPEGRGCKVFTDVEATKTEGEEGVVHTRVLKATTKEQGHFVKLEPADGPEKSFANFFVTCEEGKKIPAIEGTWECSGSFKGVPNGATVTYNHAEVTTQNTLKCKGAKVGIEFSTTTIGRHPNSGGGVYNPLSMTTVTT